MMEGMEGRWREPARERDGRQGSTSNCRPPPWRPSRDLRSTHRPPWRPFYCVIVPNWSGISLYGHMWGQGGSREVAALPVGPRRGPRAVAVAPRKRLPPTRRLVMRRPPGPVQRPHPPSLPSSQVARRLVHAVAGTEGRVVGLARAQWPSVCQSCTDFFFFRVSRALSPLNANTQLRGGQDPRRHPGRVLGRG